MYRKFIYSLSLALLLSIPARQANAAYPFRQDSGPDGIVSMEAEHFDANWPGVEVLGVIPTWKLVTSPVGASGSKAMQAWPEDPHITLNIDYVTNSPCMDFKVRFTKTGKHYVWIRGHAMGSGSHDSCHLGLDNYDDPNGKHIFLNEANDWGWFNTRVSKTGPRATLDVDRVGVHTVNVWMRENGAIIDKIVLTTNTNYALSGESEGPPESERVNPFFVDDFENYSKTNRIFETWMDGTAYPGHPGNGTGSIIGHDDPCGVYVEPNIVYAGRQSMPFYYDNDGKNRYNMSGLAYYSEAEADTNNLEIGRDWTKEGVKALALHFYGNPNNATEQMYVALEDSASHIAVVPYDGNANDVQKTSWQEWNIRLKDFTDNDNVNLSRVSKVYIGFGNRDNHPNPGGSGLVYFDDIRLYPTRCVPSRVKGNFNDDCVVDYTDFEIMTAHWLNDYQFEDFAWLADNWLNKEILWP
jgi:hypothetical protein